LPDALTVIAPDSATEAADAVIDTSPPFAFTDDESTETDVPAANVTLVPAVTGEPPLTAIEPAVAARETLPAVAVTGEFVATEIEPAATNVTFVPAVTGELPDTVIEPPAANDTP
jgi:hypothetical protein